LFDYKKFLSIYVMPNSIMTAESILKSLCCAKSDGEHNGFFSIWYFKIICDILLKEQILIKVIILNYE